MVKNIFNACIIDIGLVIGFLFGSCDGLIYTLLVFTIIDYLTGVYCAKTKLKVSSYRGGRGIIKKVGIFILVAIANIIDVQIFHTQFLRSTILFFYISNEGISIVENLSLIGVIKNEKLINVLEQVKNYDIKGDNKNADNRKTSNKK